jgi:hypothetical protein
MAEELFRDGAKFFYWTVKANLPDMSAVEFKIPGVVDWTPTDATTADDNGYPRYRKLLAGPDASTPLPTGTVVIPWTPVMVYARVKDSPEIEIGVGRIDLV